MTVSLRPGQKGKLMLPTLKPGPAFLDVSIDNMNRYASGTSLYSDEGTLTDLEYK